MPREALCHILNIVSILKQNKRIIMLSFLELSVEGLKIKLICFDYWNMSTCSTYGNKFSVITLQGETKILKGGSSRARPINPLNSRQADLCNVPMRETLTANTVQYWTVFMSSSIKKNLFTNINYYSKSCLDYV